MQSPSSPSRKKKLLTIAGLFAIPVIAIAVAIAALVNPTKKIPAKPAAGAGFNTSLPSPNLPQGDKNKMEIYMQAQQDSLKQRQDRAKDPYVNLPTDLSSTPLTKNTSPKLMLLDQAGQSGSYSSPYQDENEKKVSDRVQKIYAALESSGKTPSPDHGSPFPLPVSNPMGESTDIAHIERLMASLQQKDTSTDPQLRQVKEVLDQVMALKYPDRVVQPAGITKPAPGILPVEGTPPAGMDGFGSANGITGQNGFFGLNDDPDSTTSIPTSLTAVIHSNQTIQTGSIVKLRLLQPIYIAGEEIPANAFIYGPATISGERVTIQLTNVISNGRIYPIALKVFDGTDGLEGLFVPGMITRDVVKQNMSQGVSAMNIATLDPSLGAQAAAAGIETAKSLLSRKITLIKATLKAGHLAILKPTSTH